MNFNDKRELFCDALLAMKSIFGWDLGRPQCWSSPYPKSAGRGKLPIPQCRWHLQCLSSVPPAFRISVPLASWPRRLWHRELTSPPQPLPLLPPCLLDPSGFDYVFRPLITVIVHNDKSNNIWNFVNLQLHWVTALFFLFLIELMANVGREDLMTNVAFK